MHFSKRNNAQFAAAVTSQRSRREGWSTVANRNTLHKSKAEAFKAWLESDGWTLEAPVGAYEAIRARKDDRLALFYENGRNEHLSYDERLDGVVRAFLRKRKNGRKKNRMQWMPEKMFLSDVFKPYGGIAKAGLKKIGRQGGVLTLTFLDGTVKAVLPGEEIPLPQIPKTPL